MASKRSNRIRSVLFGKDVSVVLLDIEGTTTSISFVKDELFPYILKNVENYLEVHWDDEETKADVESLRQQAETDLDTKDLDKVVSILPESHSNKDEIINTIVENVKWQMSLDRKTTALKQLQGHMWVEAYKKEQVKGHLYPEVTSFFKQWVEDGKKLCIYSSGSVAAQKLLFKYSVDGDITQYITDYFDTKVGAKREAASYTAICEHLKVQPESVLFLTDIVQEAEAAKKAGLQSVIVRRPGNAELTEEQLEKFETIKTFDEISFDETECKTKKLE